VTVASAFSGAGLADWGLRMAGMDHLWFCEKVPIRRSILRRHYPHAKISEDVKLLSDQIESGELPAPDVFWFSPPCQDLSIAGARAGLSGERSGLFYDGLRAVKSLRDRGTRYVVMEQVPGLLSSNSGADFLAVLAEFSQVGAVSWGYRILDSQFFGVPQVRRRLFFVLDFGGERAGEILFESESMSGDFEPRHCSWQDTSTQLEDSTRECGETIGFRGQASSSQGMKVHSKADAITKTHKINVLTSTEKAHTIMAKGNLSLDPTMESYAIEPNRVRRLTPVETERCFGVPDDYTRWDENGREIKDSPRYEMLGDGVVANVSEWIGRGIMAGHE